MDLAWTGTDVLFMNQYPKSLRFRFKVKIFFFRILVKILDRYYIDRNWVVADHLGKELSLKKPIMKIDYPRSSLNYQHLIKYPKRKHKEFYVLYYFPVGKNNVEFHKWLYGWDIYILLKEYYGDRITWVVVGGRSNMSATYPVIDFYLRPNRHDGMPMMVKECIANDIPYYWSRENPSIIDAKNAIEGLIC